jgi:uncharacterized protein (DUF4415 family)
LTTLKRDAEIRLEPMTDAASEVRELTRADFVAMRRHRGERGPQKAPTKKLVSLRLDQDVIERVKQDGAGWQTRINDILRDALFKRAG